MNEELKIWHGALCKTYEEQANVQGYTYGDRAEFVQKIGFGLVCAHIHSLITDGEYDRILQRFNKKILANPEYLKPLTMEV